MASLPTRCDADYLIPFDIIMMTISEFRIKKKKIIWRSLVTIQFILDIYAIHLIFTGSERNVAGRGKREAKRKRQGKKEGEGKGKR